MKIATEFIGTFLFLFVISLAAVGGSSLAPFAIGLALVAMVYAGGHRSGAHYNPAVSAAFWVQKKLTTSEFLGYVLAQVLAGILAFFVGNLITGMTVAIGPANSLDSMKALVVEMVFTLILVLVIMNVAASRKTEANSFYGIAIGFTIVAGAIAGGPISGGAFNPAVGIGATVVHVIKGGGNWSNLWIPIVGPLVGGLIASFIWAFQEAADATPPTHPAGVPVESTPNVDTVTKPRGE